MRKLGFGFIGLLIVGAIYYFTLGKTQLITEVKKQVDTELTQLQMQGFDITNRKVEENKEYFELAFADTQKVLLFLNTHGVAVDASNIESLKGSKLGIGLQYLPDSYTSVALDIIPIKLPTHMRQNNQNNSFNALEKLLDKKALQVHIAMNKLGNGFKGYLKDINETIQTDKNMHILVNDLTFSGDLEKQKLHAFKQSLKIFTLASSNQFSTSLRNLVNTYETHSNGYKNSYKFSSLKITIYDHTMELKDTTIDTIASIENGLANINVKNHSNEIEIVENSKHYLFNDMNFTSVAKNLDISAFEKLQTIKTQNKEEMNKLLSQLLSKGVSFSLPTFSVGHVTIERQKVDGFNINAHLNVDKNIPSNILQNNPIKTLSYLDGNLKVALSSALMGLITKEPAAMLAMMMFPPQNIDGKKVYQIELKNAKPLLNGKPIF